MNHLFNPMPQQYYGFKVIRDINCGEWILKRKPRSKKKRIIKKWFNKYKIFYPRIMLNSRSRTVYCHPSLYAEIKRQQII